jgi:uncharacterized protein YciI
LPLFVLNCIDKPNSLALRAETRPAHLAYLDATGQAKLGGPYLDGAGDPVGSMIIIEADDEAAAVAFSRADPYSKAGLFETVDVRAWRPVLGELK